MQLKQHFLVCYSIIFLFFQIFIQSLFAHVTFFKHSCACSATAIILISQFYDNVEVLFIAVYVLQHACILKLLLNQNSIQSQHISFNFAHISGITFIFYIDYYQPLLIMLKYLFYAHAAKLFYAISILLDTTVATPQCYCNLDSIIQDIGFLPTPSLCFCL